MSHFVIPNHTVVGTNVLGEAAPLLKKMGNKAFIVTGRHVAVSNMMKQLTALLDENGIGCVIFDGITGEPTDTMIENGVEMLKSSGCDFIIGIGGGSPLDSAKAIAAMAVNEGSIADYNGKEITGEILPLAAIPTTAGTGSEATKFTVITDSEKGIKMLLKGDVLVPKLGIVDSSFTVGAPKSVTSATGLDALTHAVEAYTSRKAFSMTDTLAVSAVKRIMKYLPIAYKEPDNSLAREQMSIAALEAGICINNSSVTIVHGMSRPIAARGRHEMLLAIVPKDRESTSSTVGLPIYRQRFGEQSCAFGQIAEQIRQCAQRIHRRSCENCGQNSLGDRLIEQGKRRDFHQRNCGGEIAEHGVQRAARRANANQRTIRDQPV